MKVRFKRTYFRGHRFRPHVEYEVPDTWKKELPKDAVITDEAPRPAKKKPAVKKKAEPKSELEAETAIKL